ERVRIPFHQRRAHFHMVALVDLEFCAIHDGVALLLTSFIVHDHKYTVAVHGDQESFLVTDRLQGVEFDRTGILRFETGLLGNPAGGTADVEGTHRELGSGLTDGLRSNNTDSLTDLNEF